MTVGVAQDPGFVGPYRLVKRIGEGGMGVVHLALDPRGRAVALKVLRPQVSGDGEARRRLGREVATLRRVRHPNVAQVLDADLDADLPYLVTSFVPGRTIEDQVHDHGPLPPEQVAHIGRVVADALRAIHAVGIVHRDVKPANVLLLDGEPVIIDFGIAHLVDESRITVTGLVMGTPGYLSPEVVDGQPVTAATDWWGWGATLAYAASGRPPFGTGNATAVLDRVRRGHADLAGVDARLAGVLAAALVVDPARRAPMSVLLDGLSSLKLPSSNGHARVNDSTQPQLPSTVPTSSAAPTVPHAPAPTLPYPDTRAPQQPRPILPAAPPVTPRSAPAVPPRSAPAVPPRSAPAVPPRSVQPPPPAGGPAPVADPARGVGAGLAAALITVCLVAAVAPGLAVLLSVLWFVVARVADTTATGLMRRRYEHGRRPGDVPAAIAALPWRVFTATARSALALVVPALMAASVAFLAASAKNPNAPHPNAAVPLALGMAAGWVAAWWGPGGGSLRRGTRGLGRGIVRRRPVRVAVLVVLTFVCVAALLVARGAGRPDWQPLRSGVDATPIGQLAANR